MDNVATGSAQEVDIDATEKVKKGTSKKDLALMSPSECIGEAAPSVTRRQMPAAEEVAAQIVESKKTGTVECSSLGF